MKRILCLTLLMFQFSGCAEKTPSILIKKSFSGSMLGCAIGDAMGRPTEFKTMDQIFASYPNGIKSFDDFHQEDFWKNKYGKKIAPYTDDTAMAKLVFEQLIESKKKNLSLNETMGNIAREFIEDMKNPLGWTAPGRAPGNTCLKSVCRLEKRIASNEIEKYGFRWWDAQKSNGGGCGSVMHAFPFGLVFYDDLEKAEKWAVEHSKITHGHSISLAACAAMAVGTALSVQKKNPDFVVEKMIEAAGRYDKKTADMIQEASVLAKENYNTLANRGVACIERARDLSAPIFEKFQGWAAHDAIAATTYIFVLTPNNINNAIYLGVHTPGDSDSIACMAGALVGARVGVENIPQNWKETVEGSVELKRLGNQQY